MKKLIVFDLDGTLAESKAVIDPEMAGLLDSLMSVVKVSIISGGDWPQFDNQILSKLSGNGCFPNLSLLPACGTKFFHYQSGWTKLYSEDFSVAEKAKIIAWLQQATGSPASERVIEAIIACLQVTE